MPLNAAETARLLQQQINQLNAKLLKAQSSLALSQKINRDHEKIKALLTQQIRFLDMAAARAQRKIATLENALKELSVLRSSQTTFFRTQTTFSQHRLQQQSSNSFQQRRPWR